MSTVYPFPGDPTKYEDIDGLSGEMWVPLMEITLKRDVCALSSPKDACICEQQHT